MEQPVASSPVRANSLVSIVYGLLLLPAIAMIVVGAVLAAHSHGWALLSAGCVSLIGVLATWPIAHWVARTVLAADSANRQLLSTLEGRLQEISVVLNLISEQQLLSDRAKSVAYRDKDREALRRAIQEEVARKDYEAALALANDMEATFGYKQEADRFRQDIDNRRNEVVRRQISEVATMVENCCSDEQWADAQREAERIARMFPNDDQARRLPAEVESRRQAHRQQLLASWRDALARKDVDAGIEILKRLDAYLTPSEAAEMQEDARAMFRQKLQNLGNDFKAAVHEQRSQDAIRIGEQITRDYPNTRIAQEVREVVDALRQRNGAAPAGASA